jgi:hypothetical protein
MEHHCLQWIKAKLMTARPSPLYEAAASASGLAAERANGPTKMPNLRNLLRRPAKPALGNGRIQVGVERALIAHNGGPITTSIAVEWAYALRRYQGKPIKSQHLVYVRRALDRVADRLRRVPPYGAWLWKLRDGGGV